MPSSFMKQYAAARRAGAPLVAIRTPDPASTIRGILAAIPQTEPAMLWDIMNGLTGLNEGGKQLQQAVMKNGDPAKLSTRPSEMLRYCQQIAGIIAQQPEDEQTGCTVFMANAHQYWKDPATIQGVWNLRDQFKANLCTLIPLTTQGATLPEELGEDVLVLDEPLPNAAELEAIVENIWKQSGTKRTLTADIKEKAVDAVIGLAAFPAETAVSMSISKEDGLDLAGLWDRKRQVIGQTPGLSVWRGGETFDAIGGVEKVKTYLRRINKGKNAPRCVVFIDEIEKAFAGMGTDSSGVKTEMIGTLLSWMHDNRARGVIFIGPPGAAKSVVAKAAGNDASIPTVYFDLSAMQDSLVGKSGERLRNALKVIEAISQGRAFFIATCNNIEGLPPELRRRFKRGTFFFDLPTADERAVIWEIYQKKHGVSGELPNDEDWTGAEIEQCCEMADEMDMTLGEASKFVVPVARSAAEQIEDLRYGATGKFIDASLGGVYNYKPKPGKTTSARNAARKLRSGDLNVQPEVANA